MASTDCEVALRFSYRPGAGLRMQVTDRPTEPMRPLDSYTEKVLSSRARGAVYPYELTGLLAGPGDEQRDQELVEHDHKSEQDTRTDTRSDQRQDDAGERLPPRRAQAQ